MIVAFHFQIDPDANCYDWPIEKQFFKYLLGAAKDFHLEIYTGDLLTQPYRGEDSTEELFRQLLGFDPRRWRSIDPEEFVSAIRSSVIYVLAVEGLSIEAQDDLDAHLRRDQGYLGAIEVNPANRIHRQIYKGSLRPRYRYLNGNLRLYYRKFDEDAGAESRELGRAADLKQLPFRSLDWEDIGARHTVFDPYDSPGYDQRLAKVRGYLSEHLARMADEILLRTAAIDPRMNDMLFAGLTKFEQIQTAEDCAQVATSCRRFLEALADALYPARDQTKKGRDLGRLAYRNRLWAYVEENLSGQAELVIAQLQDVGKRIDSLGQLANKGVHARVSKSEIRRLIAALLILSYDLLMMTEPPLVRPMEPLAEDIVDFAKKVVRKEPIE